MAAFRPDRFAVLKFDDQIGSGNIHGLFRRRSQMHLHAAAAIVESGNMSELRQIEIGLEFTIDAGEKI